MDYVAAVAVLDDDVDCFAAAGAGAAGILCCCCHHHHSHCDLGDCAVAVDVAVSYLMLHTGHPAG